MQTGYVKSNLTKHIAPKHFYPHDVQKHGEIKILQVVRLCDSLADLFTKSLPATTFRIFVQGISMRFLKNLQYSGGNNPEYLLDREDPERYDPVDYTISLRYNKLYSSEFS
jgi:hypothetical protein